MKPILPYLLFIAFITGDCRAQQAPLDTLVKKFNGYGRESLQEKIYVHLDQRFHLTGETLWFSIYAVDGSLNKPLSLSSVAYVELTDKSDTPVLQGKIELSAGRGHGSFFLPATLASGHYQFRAYTRWMKNFKPEFYFTTIVTIVNPFAEVVPSPPNAARTRIHFFPEGGNLLAGVAGVVGFKITDENGNGKEGAGFVIGPRQDTVAHFTSGKSGLGHFAFTPSSGATYRAVLTNSGSAKGPHQMPEVRDTGYAMQLTDSGNFVRIDVASRNVRPSDVYLFVHARQVMTRAERKSMRDEKTSFVIPVSDLPEGLSHFTIFDDALIPLCERLYFKAPHQALEFSVVSEKREYLPRQKVRLTIQTGRPLVASLSAAVFKTDSLSTASSSGIMPYFWLTSDLTGTVEHPRYYFSDPTPEVRKATNDLMLTHGWRRFDWNDVLQQRERIRLAPEVHGLIMTAKVTRDGKPVHGDLIYLSSPGLIPFTGAARSNSEGNALFQVRNLNGPRRFHAQGATETPAPSEITIADPFSTAFAPVPMPPFQGELMPHASLRARSIAMQVQNIYFGDELRALSAVTADDTTRFYGVADDVYYLDDYTRFQVMEEVMREYVPGVFVRKRKDGFHFLLIDAVNGGLLPGKPMLLLDGVPVADVDQVMAIDPLKVKKLEVVKREYYLGHAVFSGIVSYTTYRGDAPGITPDPGGITIDYEALQSKRRFFDPYTHLPQRPDQRLPDQRTLLHWEPEFSTDATGRKGLEFFCSDVPGSYAVVVEGLAADGSAGSAVYSFTVKTPDQP